MRLISDDALGIITVFQEAEGEPYIGKVAVAEVILRRTRDKYMSDGTVAGTVLRRLQFSGMNADAPNRIRSFCANADDTTVHDCIRAWTEAKAGSNYAPACHHYYNPALCQPEWAIGAELIAEIGGHRFVKVK
jgi:N-acetylmuramoyl-L-alanine amidase